MTATISRGHFAVGTVIALAMGTIFIGLGGTPLLVTFIPGLFIAWTAFAWLHFKHIELPSGDRLYPIFFGVFAWQFVHFFEEFLTGFRIRFPALYGTTAYSADTFVGINMVSYFVFAVGFILAFRKGLSFLLVPVLFYAVYGAVGNAFAHAWWVVLERDYFPGAYSALAYWVLGPLLLASLVGSMRRALVLSAVFAAILIPAMTFTIVSV